MLRSQLRDAIARWLQDEMDRKGWDQTQLATAAGVDRTTVFNVIHKKKEPREGTITKLAEALGVPPPSDWKVFDPKKVSEKAPSSYGVDDSLSWNFDDESELDSQLRTLIRNVERTMRGMVTDAASIRDLQLAACRGLMRQCELAGRPVPEVLHRIYNEVIGGTFR